MYKNVLFTLQFEKIKKKKNYYTLLHYTHVLYLGTIELLNSAIFCIIKSLQSKNITENFITSNQREIFYCSHLAQYLSFIQLYIRIWTELGGILARPISKQRLISLANFKLVLTTKTHLCSGIRSNSKICAPFFLWLYGYIDYDSGRAEHIYLSYMCCHEYV